MRLAEREIKNFEEIVDLADRCDTIRLGIENKPGPYIVPLSFGYEVAEGKLVFYVHGYHEGLKHDLIKKNPYICVEGDICHGFRESGKGTVTCFYESFIGHGKAVKVLGEEAVRGMQLVLEHCGFSEYPYPKELLNIMNIYRIEMDEITGKRQI